MSLRAKRELTQKSWTKPLNKFVQLFIFSHILSSSYSIFNKKNRVPLAVIMNIFGIFFAFRFNIKFNISKEVNYGFKY